MRQNNIGSNNTERINQVLHEYIIHSDWKKDLAESKAVIYYNQIQHDIIQKFSRAYQLAGNELYIFVKSPIYANELALMSTKIINLLNQRLKSNLIKNLKFKVGDFERENDEIQNEDPLKEVILSHEEESEIENQLNVINDKELSNSLNQLYTSIMKKRKLDV